MIPIVILNRDRLYYTRNLVDKLLSLGYSDIHIADIGSTYPELLEWYKLIQNSGQGNTTIHYFENIGHKGIWDNGFLKSFSEYQWVAITDSDIMLNPLTPKNFLEEMIYVAKDFRVNKVGCAIEYLNITNSILKPIIEPIESQHWQSKLFHNTKECYNAAVDTTMCIVNPNLPFQYDAIRIAGELSITHNDWYTNFDNLTEEELYYINHCDPEIATTARHYNRWKLNH